MTKRHDATSMGDRPVLSVSLSAAEFGRWYWLKSELLAFCRDHGLPSSGAKTALAERIAAHLSDRSADRRREASPIRRPYRAGRRPLPAVRRRSPPMPASFRSDTPIGPDWRCTRALRGFFEAQCGPGFRFNGALRAFIAKGAGRRLAEAVAVYRRSRQTRRRAAGSTAIAPQFEYNRFIRDFHARHPGRSHADAVAAWWRSRGQRRG